MNSIRRELLRRLPVVLVACAILLFVMVSGAMGVDWLNSTFGQATAGKALGVGLTVVVVTVAIVAAIWVAVPQWSVPETATVIERFYDSERESSGIAPVFTVGSVPQFGAAIVSNHSDEKWGIVVQSARGVVPVEVTSEQWAKSEKGTAVQVQYRVSKLTNKVIGSRLIS